MASRTRRSFNTGNPTRLVRKEQPDRSPFKVCELIPHDSMPPGWAVESCQADAFDGKTGQTPFPRSSPNWTYPGHHKTDANDPIRTLATPLALPVLMMPATAITAKFDIPRDLLGREQLGHREVIVQVRRPKIALRGSDAGRCGV